MYMYNNNLLHIHMCAYECIRMRVCIDNFIIHNLMDHSQI